MTVDVHETLLIDASNEDEAVDIAIQQTAEGYDIPINMIDISKIEIIK